MELKQIGKRRNEIKDLLASEEKVNLEELRVELKSLNAKETEIKNAESEARAKKEIAEELKTKEEKRKAIEGDKAKEMKKEEERKMEFRRDSKEYRSGFFKNLLDQDLTVEERDAVAYVTTTSTAGALPITTLEEIWDNVTEQHSILNDITIYRTGTILEVSKHTAIVQGKAAKVNESTANDDEKNTLVKVTLSGADFSKHVDISYSALTMSVDALENYLIQEISVGLGEAISEDVIAQIKTDTDNGNKSTASSLDYSTITGLFAKLKRCNGFKLYCSNAFLYNNIASLVDTTGRPLFQPSLNQGVAGNLLGAEIRIESACSDSEMIIIDPKRFVFNMVTDIMIESAKDIKKHVVTYSGYARGQGALLDSKSAVVFTKEIVSA